MKQGNRNRNAGFSLIETLITLLVSSFVFASAALMLTIGLKSFEKVNTEVILQSESQFAEHFLTETFQEATSYKEVSSLPSGVSQAIQIKKGTQTFMLVHIDGMLLYGQVEAGEDGNLPAEQAQVTQIVERERYKTFLAKNLNTFSFSDDTHDKVVTITFNFALLGKSYNSMSVIKVRNRTL